MATEQSAFNQTMLEELLRIQEKAELKMLQKVANRVKKGNQTPGWNEKKLSDMQRLRKEIEQTLADKDKLSKVWTSKNLIKSYDDAGKRVSKVLHQPHSAMKDIVPLRLQRLILETQNAISGTSFRILRNTMDTYRDIVAESTSGILVGTETRMQASQQMLNDFAAKGITGFTDKIGRKWELASYVEMATRTASSRAALQGHVDRSMELGQDLMMVSSHAATCPICAPWGGQIISISGKTANYPTLDMAQADGLFHPNCKHTLTVWDPELEGNIEHAAKHQTEPDVEKYNAIQKQRYNERKIREYKRVEAVAMDPVSKVKAHNKILEYQAKQRVHVEQFDLRRKYTREGLSNRTGDPTKATVITKPTKPIVNTPEGKGPSIVIPEPSKYKYKEAELLDTKIFTPWGEKKDFRLELEKTGSYKEALLKVGSSKRFPEISAIKKVNMTEKEAKKTMLEFLTAEKDRQNLAKLKTFTVEQKEEVINLIMDSTPFKDDKTFTQYNIPLEAKKEALTYFRRMDDDHLKLWSFADDFETRVVAAKKGAGNFFRGSSSGEIHMDWKTLADKSKVLGNKTPIVTYFHEAGHAFEHKILGRNLMEFDSWRKKLGKKIKKDIINKFNYDAANPLTGVQSSIDRANIREANKWLETDEHFKTGISDILEGITDGKIGGHKQGMVGHGVDYWRRIDVETEAIAHFFEANISGGKRKAYIDEMFPSAAKEFNETVKMALKKL